MTRRLITLAFVVLLIGAGLLSVQAERQKRAREAWAKTVRDAGFRVTESRVVFAPVGFQVPLLSDFLTWRVLNIDLFDETAAEQLRSVVSDCPKDVVLVVMSNVSKDEMSNLKRQFPAATVVVVPPLPAPTPLPGPPN